MHSKPRQICNLFKAMLPITTLPTVYRIPGFYIHGLTPLPSPHIFPSLSPRLFALLHLCPSSSSSLSLLISFILHSSLYSLLLLLPLLVLVVVPFPSPSPSAPKQVYSISECANDYTSHICPSIGQRRILLHPQHFQVYFLASLPFGLSLFFGLS